MRTEASLSTVRLNALWVILCCSCFLLPVLVQAQESGWPGTSRYAITQNIDAMSLSQKVLGADYVVQKAKTIDRTKKIDGLGSIRECHLHFRKTSGATNSLAVVKICEGPSAGVVERYVKQYMLSTAAAGSPPVSESVRVGDIVLSRLALKEMTKRINFIAFFNNIAVMVDISLDGEGELDASGVIARLADWSKLYELPVPPK